MPTMQKAVINAVMSLGINNDPKDMHKMYMDITTIPHWNFLFFFTTICKRFEKS